MKKVWDKETGEVSLVEDNVATVSEFVGDEQRRYLDSRTQDEKDADAAVYAAAEAEIQVEFNKVGSHEIRDSLTQAERRALRQSDNDDLADLYEELITMGYHKIRRSDSKLSSMLTLARNEVSGQTFNGLSELIDG